MRKCMCRDVFERDTRGIEISAVISGSPAFRRVDVRTGDRYRQGNVMARLLFLVAGVR